MKSLLAVVFASVYGLSIRLLFGFFDNLMGIMSASFIMLVPVIIGALTVLFIPKADIKNAIHAFFMPWLTSLAILIVTMMCNIEGAICWIMIFPMFAILAGFGGVGVYFFRRYRKNNEDKPNTLNISLLLLVPTALGFAEGDRTLIPKEFILTKEVIIAAPPAKVWQSLTNINTITPTEKRSSLSDIIGFPKHLSTSLDTLAVGGKRVAQYENGLYFEETISRYEPGHLMVLDIKTDPKKIPPTVLDEHIVIGGKHVDILEDQYILEQLPDGNSRLILSSKFFINTPFNWYAGIWADYLMADILDGELKLIKNRSEKTK